MNRISETNPDARMRAYHTLSPAYAMVGGFNCSEIVQKGEWVFDADLQRWIMDPIQALLPTPLYECGRVARKLGIEGLRAALQRWPTEREYNYHRDAHGPFYGIGQPVCRASNAPVVRVVDIRLTDPEGAVGRWEYLVEHNPNWLPRAALHPKYAYNWYEELYGHDRPGR